jgi:hypothetical protein
VITKERHVDDTPQRFAAWWAFHPHRKHGIPARVAFKCACYLDEYKAATVLAPLLKTTTEPGAGAGRKEGKASAVQ